MRRLRLVFAVCGAGALIGVAAQPALAGSETKPASAHAKSGAPSAAHRGTARSHPKAARPAPHKPTVRKDHKESAVRPLTPPTGSADKPLERPPMFGPLSFGVETDPKVKARSIRGGEYDPERDGDLSKGLRPSFLGLSVKSEFSW